MPLGDVLLMHDGRPAASEALGLERLVEAAADRLRVMLGIVEGERVVDRERRAGCGMAELALDDHVDRAPSGSGDRQGEAGAPGAELSAGEQRAPREEPTCERTEAEHGPHDR